ncbi:MAG: hypothetical protein OSB46_13645, partial [Alphaproteobacteria bacterium]|nr:hypothetical protein [Alphaproteobacteria bacterium]
RIGPVKDASPKPAKEHPAKPDVTTFAVGKSILSRTSKTNVGRLMLEYGGGGYEAVGTCRVNNSDAERVLPELIIRVTRDG